MLRVTHSSRPAWALCLVSAALLAACSSSDGDATSAPAVGGSPSSGGPVSGPADRHCTATDGRRIAQSVNDHACHLTVVPQTVALADAGAGDGGLHVGDAGATHDGGVGSSSSALSKGDVVSPIDTIGAPHASTPAAGGGQQRPIVGGRPTNGEIAPRFGSTGSDDSCKYDFAYSVTPVRVNEMVTFTVAVTRRSDGAFVTGAQPTLRATLSKDHKAPVEPQQWTEDPKGVYHVGPVRFDEPGRWKVELELFQSCQDGIASPRGHAAFWVDVP